MTSRLGVYSGPYGGCCDTGAESEVYECLVIRTVGLTENAGVKNEGGARP